MFKVEKLLRPMPLHRMSKIKSAVLSIAVAATVFASPGMAQVVNPAANCSLVNDVRIDAFVKMLDGKDSATGPVVQIDNVTDNLRVSGEAIVVAHKLNGYSFESTPAIGNPSLRELITVMRTRDTDKTTLCGWMDDNLNTSSTKLNVMACFMDAALPRLQYTLYSASIDVWYYKANYTPSMQPEFREKVMKTYASVRNALKEAHSINADAFQCLQEITGDQNLGPIGDGRFWLY